MAILDSIMSQGNRGDPDHPAYGLTGWNDVPNYYGSGQDGYAVYYADDNARAMLGMMLAASALKTDEFDERLMRCLLANLRLSGRRGFQPDRIDEGPLVARGWRAYFTDTNTSFSPHYQAYLWACHLWAYRHTRFPLFLERARSAIRLTMQAYPARWRWTNGIQQERARMLLPLAWLVRLEDTPEVRGWLDRIVADLLAAQDDGGAIREELGTGPGDFPPPPRTRRTARTKPRWSRPTAILCATCSTRSTSRFSACTRRRRRPATHDFGLPKIGWRSSCAGFRR